MTRKRRLLPLLCSALWACGPDGGPDVDADALIIGDVQWTDAARLDGLERTRARAVGYLSIPARGTRCTAFLVAPNVVMTNHHCVPDAASARAARFDPTRLSSVAVADRVKFDCQTFLGSNRALDTALLACEGRPGDTFGVVELDPRTSEAGDAIYVVQQNCDYYTSPGCEPSKVLARGRLTRVDSRLTHDADTLPGSSGSPIFSRDTHRVIGLHNAGVGDDGRGRGWENKGVPMARIVPYLQANFPDLGLGAVDPTGPLPVSLERDALEPNDEASTATDLADGATFDELTVHAFDQDVFVIRLSGRASVSIDVRFEHAGGDLDAELRRGGLTGEVVASAISPDDDEQLAVSDLGPGVYYARVFGFNGASNRYRLSASIRATPDREPPPPPPVHEPPPADGPGAELFEPNDEPAAAPVVALPFRVADGLRIADGVDVDYFAFDGDGSTRSLSIDFVHEVGDLDLFVEDASGQVVAQSNGTEDYERIEQAFGPGRYFVKVAGWGSSTGPYGLSMQ